MSSNLAVLGRQREHLAVELTRVRHHAVEASAREDFRSVARLTLEAARINKAIDDTEDQELLCR